jgi:hypothetical protein
MLALGPNCAGCRKAGMTLAAGMSVETSLDAVRTNIAAPRGYLAVKQAE